MKLSYEAVRSIFRECGPMTMRDRYGEEDCSACDHADAAIKVLRGKT